jgi:4-hydroxythreonine-4-phosphate dehydrogenase
MMLYLPPQEDRSDLGMVGSGKRRGGKYGLGVIHVTLHMALREIFAAIDPEAVFEKISLAREVFSRLRRASGENQEPPIAVAALNPHGGELGRFGDEESTCIAPAVERARRSGWNVEGPLPVDTLMPRAVQGEFDAVVAMYHDQGHIALKLLDMFDAVNITLGLPILRTSVAHGTAHSIAGTATAKCSGMVQAILAAAQLAQGGWRDDARKAVQQGNFAGG